MDMLIMQGHWLATAFMLLMGISMFLYVVLDGYDLGVGILMGQAGEAERDQMIASIGPFWDANETWLVLGVGILLVAFPAAHGVILSSLYLPATLMLIALILRGVSFDFRAKVHAKHKQIWDRSFVSGSFMAAMSQGYMLGQYIMGFENTFIAHGFALLIALGLTSGYILIGACWLIMKTEDLLQKRSIRWARWAVWLTAIGITLVSIVTPLVNDGIYDKWFSMPNFILLAPIPLFTAVILLVIDRLLAKIPFSNDQYNWLPLCLAITVFLLCFLGLAYSFYPFIVPGKMTIFAAASAPESLIIIFVGAMVVLPCIIGYTIFAYRVFWGKVQALNYG